MYLISLLLPLFRVYHYLVFLRVSKLGNYSLSVHLLSGLLLKSMWLPEFSLWLRFHILMQCWPSKNFIGICCREKKTCFSNYATSMINTPPPLNFFFVSPFRHFPQHHFKKKLSHQIQCWLRISCGRAFVWERTYPLENSNSSEGW